MLKAQLIYHYPKTENSVIIFLLIVYYKHPVNFWYPLSEIRNLPFFFLEYPKHQVIGNWLSWLQLNNWPLRTPYTWVMSSDNPASEVPVEEEGLFSALDLFILSILAGMAVYWYFFKNKKQEQPTFKKLTVQ